MLDDYHAIEAPDIQAGMAFLLEHLPAHVHLVIATRADPALPLARLRARGELVEIRAADLRFTPDEAAAYLNGVMGLGLTAADVAALEGRTEGWIAALQLAGLSMQGRDDIAGFIAGFAGDDRYIVDYLVEEVLAAPDRTASATSCCRPRSSAALNGPLCDAVTGQDGGKAMLEALDRRNLFLDPARRPAASGIATTTCSRDVLQARLLRRAARARRRSCIGGRPSGTSRTANAPRRSATRWRAGDFARAADLVELAMPATGRDRQEATLRRWLEALPDDVIRVRPVLSNGYAGSLLVRGETDGRRGPPAATPSAGSTADGRAGDWRAIAAPRWSSWTRTRSARCRPGSPCTGPDWPGLRATSPAPSPMPAAPSTSSARTTPRPR